MPFLFFYLHFLVIQYVYCEIVNYTCIVLGRAIRVYRKKDRLFIGTRKLLFKGG